MKISIVEEMAIRMQGKVIIDGRNLYQLNKLKADGWAYVSVGRNWPIKIGANARQSSIVRYK